VDERFSIPDVKRHYPDHPVIGVGGIIFRGDQILLIKRGKEPGLGQWSIPGGVVQTGETLKEAVVREIREETHLEVEVLTLAKVLERLFHDSDGRVAYHYVLVDFLCQPKAGELKADSDAQEARFIPLQELSSYLMAPITIEVIHRADWLRKNPEFYRSPAGMGGIYG
jgi:8-oxo-dGTP diphosphatase